MTIMSDKTWNRVGDRREREVEDGRRGIRRGEMEKYLPTWTAWYCMSFIRNIACLPMSDIV